MQKEIKLGLVVGFALLLAILLVWYKSSEEEAPKTVPQGGTDAIETLLAGKPATQPEAPPTPAAEPQKIPVPPQAEATEEKPAMETKVTPPEREIPKTEEVTGVVSGPPPKFTPPPPPLPKPAGKVEPVKIAKGPKTEVETPEVEPEKPQKPAAVSRKEETKEEAKEEETELTKALKVQPKKPAAGEHTYVVQEGDNLHKIARKFYNDDSKWPLIYEANKAIMRGPDTMYIGLKLKIPAAGAEKEKPAAHEAVAAKKPGAKEEAPATEKAAGTEEGGKKYVVQRGDTLSSIAADEYGDGRLWKRILAANKDLKDPKDLKEGQTLIIPPK